MHAAFRPSLIDAFVRTCVTFFDRCRDRVQGRVVLRSQETPPTPTRYGRDCPWCGYACDVVQSTDKIGLALEEVTARCLRCSYMHFHPVRLDKAFGKPRPDWIDGLAASEHRRNFPDGETKE